MYVTDTGKSDCGTLYDEERIQYMKAYIGTLLKCKMEFVFVRTHTYTQSEKEDNLIRPIVNQNTYNLTHL